MITAKDIRDIRNLIGKLRLNVGLFLNGNIPNSDENILKNEFPGYDKQFSKIENYLNEYFDFALNSISNERLKEKTFIEEFLAFKQSLIDEYYRDFQRPARRDIFAEYQEKILHQDFDTVRWRLNAMANEGYLDYKVALYDILEAYTSKIQNIYSNLTEQSTPKSISVEPISSGSIKLRFSKPEIIDALYEELRYHFLGREEDFKNVLKGMTLSKPLLFPHNQNQLTEVFRRLEYNNFLLNSKTELKKWLCANFMYQHKKGLKDEIRHFNENSVWDVLSKANGIPDPTDRLCKVDWLPFKTNAALQKEKQLEKLN